MEYMDAGSAYDVFERAKERDEWRKERHIPSDSMTGAFFQIAKGILDGMQSLDEVDIIHGDNKADNVFCKYVTKEDGTTDIEVKLGSTSSWFQTVSYIIKYSTIKKFLLLICGNCSF